MVLLMLGALAQECEPVDLDATSDAAIALLLDTQYDRVLEVTDDAIDRLICLDEVADPRDLASLWQVRGAVGYYGDRPELVKPALQQAAAMNPGYFNDALGPKVRAEWVAAGEDPGDPAQLTVGPIPDEGILHVDGQPWTDQPVLLTPGLHLVQVTVGQAVAYARVVQLTPGSEMALETGLDPATRRVKVTPWLVAAAGTGLGAGAAYTGAVVATGRMRDAADQDRPQEVDAAWSQVRTLGYVATPALVVTTGALAALHLRELKQGKAPAG